MALLTQATLPEVSIDVLPALLPESGHLLQSGCSCGEVQGPAGMVLVVQVVFWVEAVRRHGDRDIDDSLRPGHGACRKGSCDLHCLRRLELQRPLSDM